MFSKRTAASALAGILALELLGVERSEGAGLKPERGVTRPNDSSQAFRDDLRLQPYVYGGGGSFISYGGSVFEFGGGLDWLVKNGLGLGGSLGVLGDGSSAISVASFDVSYHFIRDSSRLVPFVFTGIAGGSAAEYGTEGYTFIDAGGGLNLWREGLAFRIEARGRFDPSDYGDHQVGVRLGITF
jgi:hypothetical protein